MAGRKKKKDVTGPYEPWQFKTQIYRRHDGALRRQRKLYFDLCPICKENAKQITSKKCRNCYERVDEQPDEALRLVAIFMDCLDNDKAVDPRHLKRARKLLRSRGVDPKLIRGYRAGPERRGRKPFSSTGGEEEGS